MSPEARKKTAVPETTPRALKAEPEMGRGLAPHGTTLHSHWTESCTQGLLGVDTP